MYKDKNQDAKTYYISYVPIFKEWFEVTLGGVEPS